MKVLQVPETNLAHAAVEGDELGFRRQCREVVRKEIAKAVVKNVGIEKYRAEAGRQVVRVATHTITSSRLVESLRCMSIFPRLHTPHATLVAARRLFRLLHAAGPRKGSEHDRTQDAQRRGSVWALCQRLMSPVFLLSPVASPRLISSIVTEDSAASL